MIRVGFLVGDAKWKGGINFFRNLICALDTVERCRIAPVIITSLPKEEWNALPDRLRLCETVQYAPPTNRLVSIINNKIRQHLNLDIHLAAFMRSNSIDLISHATGLCHAMTPTLCWIPDFQHIKRPDFFSAEEVAARTAAQSKLCRNAAGIILSSQDALSDLASFCPEGAKRAVVLRFVAPAPSPDTLLDSRELADKYDLPDLFFHVPNQFWKHKNHPLILEALHELKKQGRPMHVICTGDTTDHRHPDHYQNILDTVKRLDLDENFRSLGVIPYSDVMSLMYHSVAVINPSHFEGWSSTVEESKSMGKRVILSDLPVHIEQSPERSIYIRQDDARDLAEAMVKVMDTYDTTEEDAARKDAYVDFMHRQKNYGRAYHDYVLGLG